MASTSQNANGIIAGINVTPMVDITLVLLIIFIVTAKIIVTPAVPLDLPRASQSEEIQVVFSVIVPANGPILVNGEPATTDADSVVDPDWLLRQICADADMVLGVVRIARWREFPAAAARRYLAAYRSKTRPDGHGHVHGANMGFRAHSYWRVGGFAALASDEDVDLVARFESAGLRIVWDAQLSVVTSRRQLGRAPDGFAAHLRSLLARSDVEPA